MTASAPSRTAAETAHVMPRSLNEPVGFSALELQPHLGADALGDPLGEDQRRRALAERDDRVLGREREPVAVALDEADAAHDELLLDDPDRARRRAHEVELADQLHGRVEARLEQRVQDHHEPRVVAQPLLHDRLDRGALHAEQLGDLGQHAGPVGDLHVQVEGALDVGDDLQRLRGLRRRGRRDHRADHVAEHRGGGLRPAGARAGHRDLGDRRRTPP